MTATIVKVRALTKSYHRGPETVHALQHVNLELHAGEVVALVGPLRFGEDDSPQHLVRLGTSR
jgi:ABC-type dipeptide/oligopeptide/nickel transport system ATPase subunit